jgi:hypothetical protein
VRHPSLWLELVWKTNQAGRRPHARCRWCRLRPAAQVRSKPNKWLIPIRKRPKPRTATASPIPLPSPTPASRRPLIGLPRNGRPAPAADVSRARWRIVHACAFLLPPFRSDGWLSRCLHPATGNVEGFFYCIYNLASISLTLHMYACACFCY